MRSSARLIIPNMTQKILAQLKTAGFAHIEAKYYAQTPSEKLTTLQHSYQLLKPDPAVGNRLRAYARYNWSPAKNTLIKDQNTDYFQSSEYNYADGGKIRKFDAISECYLNNSLIQYLLGQNIELAKQTEIVNFDQDLEVALHQIRYRATWNQPSYSSPMWLHRDDEPLVFVHLLNLTNNVIGGDNIIAPHAKEVESVIRLTAPLETIVLTKQKLHAVTPMGSSSADAAYRDILLVTFQNNPPRPLATPKVSANGLFSNPQAPSTTVVSELTNTAATAYTMTRII